jgi:hypothetical protein
MDVVVVGYWNRAILTPAGIGKRLFEVPEGTPLVVEVPMDGLAPYRVRSQQRDKLIVMVQAPMLRVEVADFDYESLQYAMTIAVRALTSLPETPVSAAGININFNESLPQLHINKFLASELDNSLSDASFVITERRLVRAMPFGQGTLNLTVATNKNNEHEILFNFDRQAQLHSELISWLQTPAKELRELVEKILYTTLRLEKGDSNATDG